MRPDWRRISRTAGAVGLLALLTACGGGGGGGDDDSANVTRHPCNPDDISSGGDPLYGCQWHLNNTGQEGNDGNNALAGEDINVDSVWATYTGAGVVAAVVDDGLQIAHPDLTDNVEAGESWDYVNDDTDPTPSNPSDAHGTAVAGLIAAEADNNMGVKGVAPDAGLVGYNMLQENTDANEADAMTRGIGVIDLSNNSWGPTDGIGRLADSPQIWRDAVDEGVSTDPLVGGRDGKGIVYFWAGGNGGNTDDSNYDGYANYRNVIAVSSANAQGERSSYSERGANILVASYGGEFCNTLTLATTDFTGTGGFNDGETDGEVSNDDYTACFNGTSGAAPIAVGVAALMLEANSDLTWRDVRRILAETARQIDPTDGDWDTNGDGHPVNHKYGFGVLDAQAAVTAAETWTNIAAQVTYNSATSNVNTAIPDNGAAVTDTINVAGSGITDIEFVEVIFSASDHTYAGDLEIILTSPDGSTQSVLARQHGCLNGSSGGCGTYNQWRFGSVRHMGESADGNWTLSVQDQFADDTGTFQSWTLNIYGF